MVLRISKPNVKGYKQSRESYLDTRAYSLETNAANALIFFARALRFRSCLWWRFRRSENAQPAFDTAADWFIMGMREGLIAGGGSKLVSAIPKRGSFGLLVPVKAGALSLPP